MGLLGPVRLVPTKTVSIARARRYNEGPLAPNSINFPTPYLTYLTEDVGEHLLDNGNFTP